MDHVVFHSFCLNKPHKMHMTLKALAQFWDNVTAKCLVFDLKVIGIPSGNMSKGRTVKSGDNVIKL